MNIENTQAQMRKGILEFCILSIIGNDEECYASEILDRMKRAKLIVVEGTLYPLLTRLKNDGYLSYQWIESNQVLRANITSSPVSGKNSSKSSAKPGMNW
jgi:PadR family transcriptional regulator PadR